MIDWKTMKWLIVITTIILSTSESTAADTPENIRNEVDKLAGLNSALSICLSSKEGKRLGTADWLEIQKKLIDIDDFVALTGDYYKDSFLFTFYKLVENDYKSAGRIESNVIARYKRQCSTEMQRDIMSEVYIIKKNINSLKSKR
jgi:NDP-sugar pyrophosphorylase family protein